MVSIALITLAMWLVTHWAVRWRGGQLGPSLLFCDSAYAPLPGGMLNWTGHFPILIET